MKVSQRMHFKVELELRGQAANLESGYDTSSIVNGALRAMFAAMHEKAGDGADGSFTLTYLGSDTVHKA